MPANDLATILSNAAQALGCKPLDLWIHTCIPGVKKPVSPTDCSELCRCHGRSGSGFTYDSGDRGCGPEIIQQMCERQGQCACNKEGAVETACPNIHHA